MDCVIRSFGLDGNFLIVAKAAELIIFFMNETSAWPLKVFADFLSVRE